MAREGRTPTSEKFNQANREIERQRSRIAEIRTNAGVVIAATSLVGSFLGSSVIELEHGADAMADVALLLLAVGLFSPVARCGR